MIDPQHAPKAALPIADDETDALFDGLLSFNTLLVAVSGGRDSLALLLLLSRWHDRRKRAGDNVPAMHALTVNHGIRPEAQEEAAHVATVSARLQVPHTTLELNLSAETAHGGHVSQKRARDARYAALITHASNIGVDAIVTGHQREDQAETLLMRLARGSGVRGLAGMATSRPLSVDNHITLCRPLLDVSRQRLTATLEAVGTDWRDDPSNENTAFERARLAAAQHTLDNIGLTATSLSRTSTRLRDADDALDWATRQALRAIPDLNASWYAAAWAALPRATVRSWPREFRVRALEYLVSAVSGSFGATATNPLSRSRLEGLAARIGEEAPFTATFAGCRIMATEHAVQICRELGRAGP
ncbi:MAG: tRNA lysidine(34) synthetase TilS [Pseudomonadota bacterium]